MTQPHRSPATAADDVAAYPILDERGDARRRFLKLCALTSVSGALGLQLVGCPSNGGVNDNSWVPWDDDNRHVAGKMAPDAAPVALVVGGGPIQVTFKDGQQAKLVVAAVVVAQRGEDVTGDVTRQAKQHAELVRDTLKESPSSVLGNAVELGKLEDALRDAINKTVGGAYVREVSIARARAPQPRQEKGNAAADEKVAERAPVARKVSGKAAPPREDKLAKVKKIWTPCRRAGCTTCGQ